jgi:hypothetical protein
MGRAQHEGAHTDATAPVLVVGTDDWAIEQATERLALAGIPTLRCHPPGEPSFPCNALVDGRTCPLDVGFDVVVTVRAVPADPPAVGELGAICGLHAGAALVTAGIGRRNPFDPWASTTVSNGGDIVEAVRLAAADRAQRAASIDLRDEVDSGSLRPVQ